MGTELEDAELALVGSGLLQHVVDLIDPVKRTQGLPQHAPWPRDDGAIEAGLQSVAGEDGAHRPKHTQEGRAVSGLAPPRPGLFRSADRRALTWDRMTRNTGHFGALPP